MSEKQPLVSGSQEPSAPPAYNAPAPPPAYSKPYVPPPQGGYQGGQQTSNTVVFVQPAQQNRTVLVGVKPPNYVILSVITMIFFCWIFGLIALLAGLQVDSLWLSGQRDEAFRQSVRARHWNIAGIIVGVIVLVCAFVVIVVANVLSCYDC